MAASSTASSELHVELLPRLSRNLSRCFEKGLSAPRVGFSNVETNYLVFSNTCTSTTKRFRRWSFWYYSKRGSASYIVREVLSVRERERERERDTERERERRKWRHHFRAIGDEFTLSLAKNSHNWRWAYTFPCQIFALFVSPFTLPVSPFTERSPLWRWNSQWVHTFHCQKLFRPLCFPSFKWHEPHDEWSKTQDKWSNPAQSYFVLPIEKLNQINTKNYWK